MNIVWAFDPYDTKLPLNSMAKLLGSLGDAEVSIEPVFVANLSPRDPRLLNLEAVDEKMRKRLATVSIPHAPPNVLWVGKSSQSAAVEALERHAISEGADFIAAFTHGRKGSGEFYRGSFSESLIVQSKLPVLVTNPSSRLPKSIKKILFASDLTTSSLKALSDCMNLAKSLHWKIVVVHASDPFLRGNTSEAVRYDQTLKKHRLRIENMGQKNGVPVNVIFDNQFKLVSEIIFENAEAERCEMIAISSSKGKAGRALLGSISRKVFRESRIPVLSMHT